MKKLLSGLGREVNRSFVTKVVSGNDSVAEIAYALTENTFFYPISPSTDIAVAVERKCAMGEKNIWGQVVSGYQMQHEGGVAAAVHGSLVGGGLCTTFSASQGLLLMIPDLYKIAGELLPAVFHITSRGVEGQGLTIFCDYSDIMACRGTGFSFLSSGNVQECHDFALISTLSALESSVPFIHFFDGHRTSSELQKIEMFTNEELKDIYDNDGYQEFVDAFKLTGCSPEKPTWRGVAQSEDIFMQMCERNNEFYLPIPEIVQKSMDLVYEKTGRRYNLFDYHGAEDAEHVIVTMGSAGGISEEVVDQLVKRGEKVGILRVRLFRPWSGEDFNKMLPKSCKKIAVLDRVREPGAVGEPLYSEVRSSLFDYRKDVEVIGGRFGLGSKDFNPDHVLSVFEELKKTDMKPKFTVGIEDDVTMLSLDAPSIGFQQILSESDAMPKRIECKFWGIGGDGAVGANQQAIQIIGNNTDLEVQGFFQFDAKKSGGVTISHLRFGEEKIDSSYLVNDADFISVGVFRYLDKFDILKEAKTNSVVLINCPFKTVEELEEKLPKKVLYQLAQKNLHLYCIDASSVARAVGLGNRTNMILQTCFFKIGVSEIMDFEKGKKLLEEAIVKEFSEKSDEIVEMNLDAVSQTLDHLQKIEIPTDKWMQYAGEKLTYHLDCEEDNEFVKNWVEPCVMMEGNSVPVSACPPGGKMSTGHTRYEKRGHAFVTPKWNADNCIQCNSCAFVCPHAVIRPFLLTEEEASNAPVGDWFKTLPANAKLLKEQNLRFVIHPSVMDCTGCANCVENCPTEPKALEMTPFEERFDRGDAELWKYLKDEVPHKTTRDILPPTNFTNIGFLRPYLEFHGACAGCGEVTYFKHVTSMFPKAIIANASGCSSVWGGYSPSCPYVKDENGFGPTYGNSLFEDNAEYGFGMVRAFRQTRRFLLMKVQKALEENLFDSNLTELLNKWIEVFDDEKECEKVSDEIKEILKQVTLSEDVVFLENMKEYLAEAHFFFFGGDGWSYDIGISGILHVLKSPEKFTIVVADTEMYSNTGGQTSKATSLGSKQPFAYTGKKNSKMDLGAIARSFRNVYVASVSMGANRNQFLKAIKEAESFDGPSLVICYAPCIGHGAQGSMRYTQEQEQKVVECGYWPLYRFDPRLEKPFQYDFKKIDVEKLEDWMDTNLRFSSLKLMEGNQSEYFREQLKKDIVKRHEELLELDQKVQ